MSTDEEMFSDIVNYGRAERDTSAAQMDTYMKDAISAFSVNPRLRDKILISLRHFSWVQAKLLTVDEISQFAALLNNAELQYNLLVNREDADEAKVRSAVEEIMEQEMEF